MFPFVDETTIHYSYLTGIVAYKPKDRPAINMTVEDFFALREKGLIVMIGKHQHYDAYAPAPTTVYAYAAQSPTDGK